MLKLSTSFLYSASSVSPWHILWYESHWHHSVQRNPQKLYPLYFRKYQAEHTTNKNQEKNPGNALMYNAYLHITNIVHWPMPFLRRHTCVTTRRSNRLVNMTQLECNIHMTYTQYISFTTGIILCAVYQTDDDGKWIQCEGQCQGWFHFRCARVKKAPTQRTLDM